MINTFQYNTTIWQVIYNQTIVLQFAKYGKPKQNVLSKTFAYLWKYLEIFKCVVDDWPGNDSERKTLSGQKTKKGLLCITELAINLDDDLSSQVTRGPFY